MKLVPALLLTLISLSAHAADDFVKRGCYRGCSFDGLQAAERTCAEVAQGINLMSNEKVQLVATCRQDDGTYCSKSGFCTFGDEVLETRFIVH